MHGFLFQGVRNPTTYIESTERALTRRRSFKMLAQKSRALRDIITIPTITGMNALENLRQQLN